MEYVIPGAIFFAMAVVGCLTLNIVFSENTWGFVFSDKFWEYYGWTAFWLILALAVTKTVPSLLIEELGNVFVRDESILSLIGFLLGLFGGLAVFIFLLTYIEILIVAGARKLSNWINTL